MFKNSISVLLFSNKKISDRSSEEMAIGLFHVIKNFKTQEI